VALETLHSELCSHQLGHHRHKGIALAVRALSLRREAHATQWGQKWEPVARKGDDDFCGQAAQVSYALDWSLQANACSS